jgi:hypothetical protein
LLTR